MSHRIRNDRTYEMMRESIIPEERIISFLAIVLGLIVGRKSDGENDD